jgi:HD-GYP domain-containing protein (c-di-GMP phosphodiesterase class II)
MIKILLIQDYNPESRAILAKSIERDLDAKVYPVSTLLEANKIANGISEDITMMVCNVTNPTPEDLEKFQVQTATIPTVLCLNHKYTLLADKSNVVRSIPSGITFDVLMALHDLINEKTVETRNAIGQFFRININMLLAVCPLKVDIYIKISETKYIKMFKQGDEFGPADCEKYIQKKGVEFLYIKSEDISSFILKYQTELDALKRAKSVNLESLVKIHDVSFETVQELSKQLGFSKEVQAIAKKQIELTIKGMGQYPSLKKILSKLDLFNGKYLTAHSCLTGIIACSIASQLDWGSESTLYKLNLAAFLHDIVFDNSELAACETIEEAEQKFSAAEVLIYKNHSTVAAEISRKFTGVPPDVDSIIAQHHELPDGTGFPRKITHSYVTPLSAVFVIAHDFADYVLRAGLKNYNSEDFIEITRKKYFQNRYKRIVQVLDKLETNLE